MNRDILYPREDKKKMSGENDEMGKGKVSHNRLIERKKTNEKF